MSKLILLPYSLPMSKATRKDALQYCFDLFDEVKFIWRGKLAWKSVLSEQGHHFIFKISSNIFCVNQDHQMFGSVLSLGNLFLYHLIMSCNPIKPVSVCLKLFKHGLDNTGLKSSINLDQQILIKLSELVHWSLSMLISVSTLCVQSFSMSLP